MYSCQAGHGHGRRQFDQLQELAGKCRFMISPEGWVHTRGAMYVYGRPRAAGPGLTWLDLNTNT